MMSRRRKKPGRDLTATPVMRSDSVGRVPALAFKHRTVAVCRVNSSAYTFRPVQSVDQYTSPRRGRRSVILLATRQRLAADISAGYSWRLVRQARLLLVCSLDTSSNNNPYLRISAISPSLTISFQGFLFDCSATSSSYTVSFLPGVFWYQLKYTM